MEHSKKFVLVPENQMQVMDHMSELDQQMKNILQNRDLPESEKATLYLQILQKYTNFSIERKVNSAAQEEEKEELNDEPLVKTEKDEIEEKVMNAAPVQYKDTAKDILQFLKGQNLLKWNDKGEIIYEEKIVPRTNIIHLVNDLLRNRKKAPIGQKMFHSVLKNLQFPQQFDVKKKLFRNENIVKKPVMYARKNAWIKL